MAAVMSGYCTSMAQTQESDYKKTLETRYVGTADDDQEFKSDWAYCYDAYNKLVFETYMEDYEYYKKYEYVYDENGRVFQKSSHQYYEEDGAWFGSNCEEYTYNEDGTVKTFAKRNYDVNTNELLPATSYIEYTYTDGRLVKEETKKYSDNAVTSYTDYTYNASNQLIIKKSYTDGGSYFSSQVDYTYNADGTLAEMVTQTRRFTIDPDKPSFYEKENYTYDDKGLLTEKIIYGSNYFNGEFKKWLYSKKYEYTNDPVNGNVTSYRVFNADNDVQTGEFKKWRRNNRYDMVYSNQLGESVIPTNLEYINYVSGLTLSWNTPATTEGLSGYRIYKDYKLLDTLEGNVNSYVDKTAKKGDKFDYFVQAVYNGVPQNISSILTIEVGETVPDPEPENPYKMTSEDRWLDSGLEGEDPELSSQIRYFYDSTCKLIAKSVNDNDAVNRTLYVYNANNKVQSETNYQLDGETWYAGSGVEYTYNGNGALDTETPRLYDFNGNIQDATTYIKYIYEGGFLTKKEMRKAGSDEVIEYTTYAYNEAGKLETQKGYDNEDMLLEEVTYTYNENNVLTEKVTKAFQFTVDPDNLSNKDRETYTYDENGLLTEKIVWTRSNVEGQKWVQNERFVYTVDPESKQVITRKEFTADLDMQTGEFKKWKQDNRYEFAYTDQLSADKAPAGLEGMADSQGIHLTWNKPQSPATENDMQLTGFNIYRDYTFLATVPAGAATEEKAKYTDTDIEKEVTYEYFVQSVYDENVLTNVCDKNVSVEAVELSIDEVQMTTVVYGSDKAIEVRGNDVKAVEVYSLAGAQVAHVKAQSDNVVVSGMPQGTYIVKVITNAGEYKQKVAVK